MESTFALKIADLDSEVGTFAGFGPGDSFGGTAWNSGQLEFIRRSVLSGQRSVYFTQEVRSIDGKIMIPGGYDWSFLKPVATVTLVAGANTADLPDDFGGILGRAITATPTNGAGFPIPYVGEGQMYQAELSGDSSGRPCWALVEQYKGTSASESTRARLRFWPTADQEYTLKFWYSLLPDAITNAKPYVYGGAQHAETFKAAVRAAYEKDYDGVAGIETQNFIERLKASISMDRKMKPLEMGRNRDSSDDYGNVSMNHYGRFGFNVNGVEPSVWSAY